MDSKTIKNKAIMGFVWRMAERCGAQLVSFIVSIVLARLLTPEAYGTIGLITVFTNILNVFIDSGLGTALVQKKDVDDEDYSSVFYFNICMCVILYIVMFLLAPYIARFYNDETLTLLVRILSLTLIIAGVKGIQQAYVSRNLLFKRFFFSTLGGTVFSAVVGIWLAYRGLGVWALVVQQLSNATVDTIILWLTVKWRPKKIFSFYKLRELFSYGWKLLVSALLDTSYNQIRDLIIGKLYTTSSLAFYSRGKSFPDLIIANVNTSIDSVLLPAMSAEQDDVKRVKTMTRRSIKISTYIMAPLMMGLAFCGTSVISIVLGEKWLLCVPYMRIFCITSMFFPIHTANLNAIKALGRSDLFLRLEIIKKVVGIIILIISMRFGVMAIAYGALVSSVASQIINSWPNKDLLRYGYLEQLKDIFPGIVLAVIMGICIYPIQLLGLSSIVLLVIQIPCGAVVYIILSKIFKLESYNYIYGMAKKYLKNIIQAKR